MVKKLIYYILPALALFLLLACEVEYPWKLQETAERTMVVEGIITNELKPQSIDLSISNTQPNLPASPLSGASIMVTDGVNVFTFAESQKPGSYISTPFQAVVGKVYHLKITYQSHMIEARDSMLPVTPLAPYNFSNEKDSMYSYNYPKTNDAAWVKVHYNWAGNDRYAQQYGSYQAEQFFYVLNNVDVNKEFGPEKETIRFPKGTKIVRTKYSLSPIHQKFLRSLLMETDWRGGIFDVLPGNVTTNLSNGALGFFGACMVVKDSTIVK